MLISFSYLHRIKQIFTLVVVARTCCMNDTLQFSSNISFKNYSISILETIVLWLKAGKSDEICQIVRHF